MGTVKKKTRRAVKQPSAAHPLAAREAAAVAGLEAKAPERPLRPSQCRTHLKKTVAAAYRDIVAGFVGEAKSGSCQHLKMATEVVESKGRTQGRSRSKGPAERMLEELEREFPGDGL